MHALPQCNSDFEFLVQAFATNSTLGPVGNNGNFIYFSHGFINSVLPICEWLNLAGNNKGRSAGWEGGVVVRINAVSCGEERTCQSSG